MSEIIFKGTFGKVEGVYSHNRNLDSPSVLIVSNNNSDKNQKRNQVFDKTTRMVVDTFIENDFSVLRFDFMNHNVEKNEVDVVNLLDMTIALDWLHNKNIECRNFWVCGVDHGALISLQLAMRRPELDNYVLISPSIRKSDLNFIIPCSACGFIVRGSEDVRFAEDEWLALQDKLITKAESKVRCATIYGAGIDFSSEAKKQFKTELSNYIKEKVIADRKNLKHVTAGKRRRRKKGSAYSDEEKIIYINPVKALEEIENI
jgi:alpha/beta superfamily hydrolase